MALGGVWDIMRIRRAVRGDFGDEVVGGGFPMKGWGCPVCTGDPPDRSSRGEFASSEVGKGTRGEPSVG